MNSSVTIGMLNEAREALRGIIVSTPLLHDDLLSDLSGANIFVKAECLQKSGSFKIRGAYNKIHALSEAERVRGVVAPSAGNHAQGVALAARLHNVRATIVMPRFAPLTKIEATRRHGAEIVLWGDTFDDAAARARELAHEQGFTLVHAFDDPLVIAGQGTLGFEIHEALPDVDVVVVPIGGGGLIAGMAVALKVLRPEVHVIGVQAAGCAAMRPSLAAGYPVSVAMAQTIADGIAVKRPGEITLPLIREFVDEIVEVTDDEIARGIAHCAQALKLVVEGAGAASVAALLAGRIGIIGGSAPSKNVALAVCGGNIDANLLARVLEQVLARQGRYVLLKLAVVDRPGALARVVNSVAETGANVIDIFHRRALWLAPLGKVGVELVLEVRDEAHSREVIDHLENTGYHVEREGVGLWPE